MGARGRMGAEEVRGKEVGAEEHEVGPGIGNDIFLFPLKEGGRGGERKGEHDSGGRRVGRARGWGGCG